MRLVAGTVPPSRTLGRWLTTTPGRLRVASIGLCFGAVAFCLVAAAATHARQQAVQDLRSTSEPSVVDTGEAYVLLSEADATAAKAFVTGGIEPAAQRQRYLDDLRTATDRLIALNREKHLSSELQQAVQTVSEQLPRYSGLVETARGYNRQGFPIGAAYMREASAMMRDRILPSIGRLYTAETQRLSHSYRSSLSWGALTAVVVAGIVMIGFLVATQLSEARRTHRRLNLGLLAASAVILILTMVVSSLFLSGQHHLTAARRQGSDPAVLFSSGRILALRLQADESLALIARGSGSAYLADFDGVALRLGGTDGAGALLGEAKRVTGSPGSKQSVDELIRKFGDYLATHQLVARQEVAGSFTDAVTLAVRDESPIFDGLTTSFQQRIAAGQARFASEADMARSRLDVMLVFLAAGALLGVALTLFGLQPRIREYP